MSLAEKEQNNFGFLRLFFAGLVVYAHSSQLVYSGYSHDFLNIIFGTIPSGLFAVNGFFLISGYLIVKSYIGSRNVVEYIKKRILRIHPGYIVSYIICLLIVAPIIGGSITKIPIIKSILYAIFLKVPPEIPGLGIELNGSMWTIAYEFRCYMLVIFLGLTGFIGDRKKFLALTILLINLVFLFEYIAPDSMQSIVGRAYQNIRFMAIFCSGSCFYLFRDKIEYRNNLVCVAAILFCAAFTNIRLVYPATMVFGGYLLFWATFYIRNDFLSSIGRKTDISYGLYLYGWPIQIILLHFYPNISMWQMFSISLPSAELMGYISWVCVENRFLRLKPHK